jgi:CRP/FNR family transcriptional regulator
MQKEERGLDLGGIALFAPLNAAARNIIESRGVLRRYEPDAMLWQAGEVPNALHIVLEGEVRVVRSSNGRQRVVHQEERGGTLGDVALFSSAAYPATAIAATRVSTLALTTNVLHEVIAADPTFALALLRGLAERVRQLIERMDRQASWSVQARVARYVLERHEHARGSTFTLGMTQHALAEELGTAREVIVRALRGLKESGLLHSAGRGRFRVEREAGLRALARPSG